MKRISFLVIALFALSGAGAFAQRSITVGMQGGYHTRYHGMGYGADVSYTFNPMLELNLSGLMGTSMFHYNDNTYGEFNDLKYWSLNAEMRFMLINWEAFSTGPQIGGQLMSLKYNDPQWDNFMSKKNVLGFNLGWHVRYTPIEHLNLNAGVRYTSTKHYDCTNTYIYLGVGYSFNLF